MDVYVFRRCAKCGHTVPGPGMSRVHWKGKACLFCGPCYQELVEKRTGYRQTQFEFTDESGRDERSLPF